MFNTNLDLQITQVLRLQSNSSNAKQKTLESWERNANQWSQVFSPIKVVIGTNGLIAPENKQEGDRCTPEGSYSLNRAFGYFPINTKMNYYQLTDDDCWIDDPSSPAYNQFVTKPPLSISHEKMRRSDDLYKLGIVIEYNTAPAVPGRGSAIFIHIWRGPDSSTAGCVAMAEENIKKLLDWLDPAKSPIILL